MGGALDLVLAALMVVIIAGGSYNQLAQARPLSSSPSSSSSPPVELIVNPSIAITTVRGSANSSSNSSPSSSTETKSISDGVVSSDSSPSTETKSISDGVVLNSSSDSSPSIETDDGVRRRSLADTALSLFKALREVKFQVELENGEFEVTFAGNILCMTIAISTTLIGVLCLHRKGLLIAVCGIERPMAPEKCV